MKLLPTAMSLLACCCLFATTANQPPINWGLNFRINANSMVIQLPQSNVDGRLQTSTFLSPGIGLYAQPWHNASFSLLTNLNFETRGSGNSLYISDPSGIQVLDVNERYRCLTADIQFRYQLPITEFKPFIGIGGGVSGVLSSRNGIVRNGQEDDLSFLPPNAFVTRAETYNQLLPQLVAAAGFSIGNYASFELCIQHDQLPVLDDQGIKLWLWSHTFNLRLNLAELYRREHAEKAAEPYSFFQTPVILPPSAQTRRGS